MSPTLFAQEMTEHAKEDFNRLARVWFDDETILQRREADGYTGHDTLIIGMQYANDLKLTLWIDEGVRGTPVAMAFQSDRKIIITPIYKKAKYYRKLSPEQIKLIFDEVFNNPQLIEVKQEADDRSNENLN
jgi:hypothetical protein